MKKAHLALISAASLVLPFQSASAELVLSQLVVELKPGKLSRQDIEVYNTAPERAYVVVEPHRLADAGKSSERRVTDPDPEKLGLLVAPARMILEPGQRKLIRFADIGTDPETERVYRVTVKPVIGEIEAEQSGLKILVGYDVLVLVRPAQPAIRASAVRRGSKLTWRNEGNASVELTDGRQCSPSGGDCTSLPGKRLYAGASWVVDLPKDAPVDYLVRSPTGSQKMRH